MRILELRMKNYGKFSDHTIRFHDGINILYGENEAGKSTIHSFIRAMLFGIGKARGRAAKSDEYSLREPWVNPGYFAGGMRFESGRKIFRLERNFNRREKSVSLVCETDGEELSVEDGDLDVLLEGMNEVSFSNTFLISQKGGATEEGLAHELHHYLSNVQSAGDAGIDVRRAAAALDARRREAESAKKKQTAEHESLEREVENRLGYVRQEIRHLEAEETEGTEKLRKLEQERAKNLRKPGQESVDDQEHQTGQKESLWSGKTVIFFAILGITALLAAIFLPSVWMKLLSGSVCICAVYGLIRCRNRQENQKRESRKEEEAPDEEADRYCEKQKGHLEYIGRELREKRTIQENIQEHLRELQEENGQDTELDREIAALKLAAATLAEASKEVYDQWGGRLNRRVSAILSEITEGRYTSIFLDEDLQIRINTPEKLLAIRQVSRGTMEQIYFALRMAAGELLSGGEPVPVILDEAFAMYDDERLEQTMRWLEKSGKQVLLFTCHRREGEILRKIRGEQ